MRLAIIGSGYVGLVAGTCFADSGNDVICVDSDARKVGMLEAGRIPIYEPGLEELVARNVAAGRLRFSTDLGAAVKASEVVFIAVGTPEGETGEADLSHVLAAAREIARAMERYTIVVDKSTVPVGTAALVRREIEAITRVPFDVVSNPEFLKEGAAIEDFMKPDRVVLGVESERARETMRELYAPFCRTRDRLLFMDPKSAELTKYAANSMLAVRISFINEIARLCERVGADVDLVRKGIGTDKRIGLPFLFPGCGWGGSCFPKDVKALYTTGREHGVELSIVHAASLANEEQKGILLRKALKHFNGRLDGLTFGVWGLAFKPKTDDMREAPSIVLIEGLLGKGARVQAHDPVAHETARRVFGDRILYASNPYAAVEGADALFVVTEWMDFRFPDFERMKGLMKRPVVFDGRNLWEPERMRERGFEYFAIGRP
jgi:UDPglucose 6-dehydrogenase